MENSKFMAKVICREVKDGLHIMSLKSLETVPEEEEEEVKRDMENGVVAEDGQNTFSSSAVSKKQPRKCVEVIVSHVESRRVVWVQEVAREQELYSVSDELQTLGQSDLDVFNSPQLGDFVAATFLEDSNLYRARVVSSSPSRCTVIFVDFGNSEEKDKRELLKLPLHLQEDKLSAFAEQVIVAESDGGWSKEQLENLKGEVVAMSMNSRGEAVLNRINEDQGDPEESAEKNFLTCENSADWLKEHLDNLKVEMNSRGEAVSAEICSDSDQGDQEEKSDENNNVLTSDGAMEITDGDPDDVAGISVEVCHSVATSLSMNSVSSNDPPKFDQPKPNSTSQMKKTPGSTIIDASDGEECELGFEDTLSSAAEQEADVEEKSKESLGKTLLDSEIEMTLSPSGILDDDSGFLEDIADAEAEQLVDKLMAEECGWEEKRKLLASLHQVNLHQAIHPMCAQVLQAACVCIILFSSSCYI